MRFGVVVAIFLGIVRRSDDCPWPIYRLGAAIYQGSPGLAAGPSGLWPEASMGYIIAI